jgi:hypothetical protein
MSIADKFAAAIEEANRALSAVTKEEANQAPRPGGWLRKEELGHLLDSAQNNHQRIVLAVLNGEYAGPEYAQNDWVELHGYRDMPWAELLAFWFIRNQMLHRIIARIPGDRLDATMAVGENPGMSLSAWIDDYLQHMAHHVEQITAKSQ